MQIEIQITIQTYLRQSAILQHALGAGHVVLNLRCLAHPPLQHACGAAGKQARRYGRELFFNIVSEPLISEAASVSYTQRTIQYLYFP